MSGMPSARGQEWRTDGQSKQRFEQGFDAIPRNPDGTMRIEPLVVNPVEYRVRLPENCYACTLKEGCEASCAHGSEQCRARVLV
jgi:hypothetical protein